MQRPQFVSGEIYHVYNRGVEKRRVFLTDKDYLRFIGSMGEFNDSAPTFNFHRQSKRSKSDFKQGENPFVDILCFCLMPNHYHFVLRQRVDGGITEFMRKIGTGYTNYFNLKQNRVGPLFQGKFKAVLIEREAHLLYLPHYIHLNPLDLSMPEWREQKIRDLGRAMKFLESYSWSSYLDYIGEINFPSVISPDFLYSKQYKQEIKEWLSEFNLDSIHEVAIEDV